MIKIRKGSTKEKQLGKDERREMSSLSPQKQPTDQVWYCFFFTAVLNIK